MKPANRVLVTKDSPILAVHKAIGESSFKSVVNLGLGAFGYNPPDYVLDALKQAVGRVHVNQYSPSKGLPRLRNALAKSHSALFGRELNPETEILVTTGANEGTISTVMAYVNPGDEVLVMEPYFPPYLEKIAMAGGVVKFFPLKAPVEGGSSKVSSADWIIDMEDLQKVVTPRTRILILNTPHNPTGKIFSQSEIKEIGNFCKAHSLILISDEVYSCLDHRFEKNDSAFAHPGVLFPELTITVGSAGKDFAATGWRVGFLIGSSELLAPVAKTHLSICFSAPSPPQEAFAVGYELAEHNGHWNDQLARIQRNLKSMNEIWRESGLQYIEPQGGYTVMVSLSKVRIPDSVRFPSHIPQDDLNAKLCWFLINEIGVVGLPPTFFYSPGHPGLDRNWFRFAVNKDDETIEVAKERLLGLKKYIAVRGELETEVKVMGEEEW